MRALAAGIEFSIGYKDVPLPLTCVYLGNALDYFGRRKGDYSATIDRIDATKGYIVGNIQVISWLANRMKTNASLEQLVAFAHGVLQQHG